MCVSVDTEVLSVFELDVRGIQPCCYFVPCFSSSVLNVRFVRFVHFAYDSNLLYILPLKQYMHIPQCVFFILLPADIALFPVRS